MDQARLDIFASADARYLLHEIHELLGLKVNELLSLEPNCAPGMAKLLVDRYEDLMVLVNLGPRNPGPHDCRVTVLASLFVHVGAEMPRELQQFGALGAVDMALRTISTAWLGDPVARLPYLLRLAGLLLIRHVGAMDVTIMPPSDWYSLPIARNQS